MRLIYQKHIKEVILACGQELFMDMIPNFHGYGIKAKHLFFFFTQSVYVSF